MAADTRPFKSKEQDGQGNEIIMRDQQLVEQGNATTMPSGAFFETLDVDNRPVKIPRDNMMNIVLECIGIILNDNSKNLGTNVQKALGLQDNTIGHSTVADFASVLGVPPTTVTVHSGERIRLTTGKGGLFVIYASVSDTEKAYGIAYVTGSLWTLYFFTNCKVENGITMEGGAYVYLTLTSNSGNDISVSYKKIV